MCEVIKVDLIAAGLNEVDAEAAAIIAVHALAKKFDGTNIYTPSPKRLKQHAAMAGLLISQSTTQKTS